MNLEKRNELILSHMKLMYFLVEKFCYLFRIPYGEKKEDVTSAATLALVEASREFDETRGVKFSTFAFRRIIWYIVNEKRNLSSPVKEPYRRNPDERVSFFYEELDENLPYEDGNFHEFFTRESLREIFSGNLGILPERQMKIIQMRYFDGKTHEEIGRKLSLTKFAVWSYEQRALAKLRKRI